MNEDVKIDGYLYSRIQALNKCTFLPASYEKRFARSMAEKQVGDVITSKQFQKLQKMFERYRKQLGGK